MWRQQQYPLHPHSHIIQDRERDTIVVILSHSSLGFQSSGAFCALANFLLNHTHVPIPFTYLSYLSLTPPLSVWPQFFSLGNSLGPFLRFKRVFGAILWAGWGQRWVQRTMTGRGTRLLCASSLQIVLHISHITYGWVYIVYCMLLWSTVSPGDRCHRSWIS